MVEDKEPGAEFVQDLDIQLEIPLPQGADKSIYQKLQFDDLRPVLEHRSSASTVLAPKLKWFGGPLGAVDGICLLLQ